MAYDPGAIDAALAAAIGDDPALIAELRRAFVESARKAIAALDAASDEAGWQEAAWRLRSLAASFGAVRLMALAADAASAPVGDVVLCRKLARMIDRL